MKKYMQEGNIYSLPELSLASKSMMSCNSSSQDQPQINHLPMKRKLFSDNLFIKTDQTSVDLQLNDPLPLDWEQCLDLESGRMYYLNRKTSRKSWNWPKDQKLDLELNISLTGSSTEMQLQESYKKQQLSGGGGSSSSSTNMLALACLNCHLLVILSKSSPSCPNCKYVHSLIPNPQKITTTTLSLLN